MELDPCPECGDGKLLYNPRTERMECTSCSYFEVLGKPETEDEIAKENQKELKFLRKYNNCDLIGEEKTD